MANLSRVGYQEMDVNLTPDHLEQNFVGKDPYKGLTELIWNSLDADAKNVKVEFLRGKLGGIEALVVDDDGHGLKDSEIGTAFQSYGSSFKKAVAKSPKGRFYHGKKGSGRFHSFSIGRQIEWTSTFENAEGFKTFTLKSDANKGNKIGYLAHADSDDRTGVRVEIRNLSQEAVQVLESKSLLSDLATTFAHYLQSYKGHGIKISVDGTELDIENVVENKDRAVFSVQNGPEKLEFSLEMYHWKDKSVHKRCFCTADGVVVEEDGNTGIKMEGFGHSIYISSPSISENNLLLFRSGEIFEAIEKNVDRHLHEFLLKYLREKSKVVVEALKQKGAYPYQKPPENDLEEAKRSVYDYAVGTIASRLSMTSRNVKSTGLILNLLKEAMENSPEGLGPILEQVVKLPKEDVDNFNYLLKKASLSDFIKASKVLTDRIAFIAELRELLGDKKTNKAVLERQHLHKILENELWVFGDGYQLGTSDETLRKVLEKHVKVMGRDHLVPEIAEKDMPDERPDLFLYRQYPQTSEGKFEHLVIELKRPSCVLGDTETNQIYRYATDVSNNPMFDKANTRWTFILVGHDYDQYTRGRVNAPGKTPGTLDQIDNGVVLVKKWGEILQALDWKYKYLKEKIESFSHDPQDLEYIRKTHGHLFKKNEV